MMGGVLVHGPAGWVAGCVDFWLGPGLVGGGWWVPVVDSNGKDTWKFGR